MTAINTAAQTDVQAFIEDLDGGRLQAVLATVLSEVGAGCHDFEKKTGEVSLNLKFKKIPGTGQLTVEHTLKFVKPTEAGKAGEEMTRSSVFHVGKYGRLTSTPESQTAMFDRQGQTAA